MSTIQKLYLAAVKALDVMPTGPEKDALVDALLEFAKKGGLK